MSLKSAMRKQKSRPSSRLPSRRARSKSNKHCKVKLGALQTTSWNHLWLMSRNWANWTLPSMRLIWLQMADKRVIRAVMRKRMTLSTLLRQLWKIGLDPKKKSASTLSKQSMKVATVTAMTASALIRREPAFLMILILKTSQRRTDVSKIRSYRTMSMSTRKVRAIKASFFDKRPPQLRLSRQLMLQAARRKRYKWLKSSSLCTLRLNLRSLMMIKVI